MEHKHAEVLRAIADGKEVEYKYSGQWFGQTLGRNPIECPHLEWRIKPEPKPPVVEEWHLIYGGHGNFFVDNDFEPNIRFTFDPDTKLPIKVELI